jgi:hypothetical protein
MFDKRKHGFITATQSFALEMTRVILKDMIGVDPYFTQTTLDGHELIKFSRGHVDSHPLADTLLELHVSGLFTCLEYPREISRPGMLSPPLPSFGSYFELYNSNENYFDWEIGFAHVGYSFFTGPKESEGRTLRFVPSTICLNEIEPSERIKNIAKELQKRMPRRMREVE